MRWSVFRMYLFGLLSCDSRLSRHFQAKHRPKTNEPGGGDEHVG